MQALIGTWSSYEAEGYGSMEDQIYVFAADGLGVSIYFNAIAATFELFQWSADARSVTFSPMRSVFVRGNGESASIEEGEPASSSTHAFVFTDVELDGQPRQTILSLEPPRGTGARYARSRLNERLRAETHRYLGIDVM